MSFGPNWRTASTPARPGIPNTVGGAVALGLRRSLGSTFYMGVASELALTTQLSPSSNPSIGDWTGTAILPLTPSFGVRVGGLHITLGYPLFTQILLLSETARGEKIQYRDSIFYQGSVFFETDSGLFGFQYRKGSFRTEKTGETESTLDPKMEVSAFSLLFTLPLF